MKYEQKNILKGRKGLEGTEDGFMVEAKAAVV